MTLSNTEQQVLGHLLDEAAAVLEDVELDKAAVCIAEAKAMAAEHAEVREMEAELALARGEVEEAVEHLRGAIAAQPEHADAHHLLGILLGERDDFAGMVEHFLETLRLDAAADTMAGVGSPDELALIEAEAESILQDLPEPFATRLADIPVVLEARPHPGIVAEGFDPRAVGMFEGPDEVATHLLGIGTPSLRPTRIVIFYANLLASCRSRQELSEQLEITLLHEIGHFFGLDEAQVAALGLD